MNYSINKDRFSERHIGPNNDEISAKVEDEQFSVVAYLFGHWCVAGWHPPAFGFPVQHPQAKRCHDQYQADPRNQREDEHLLVFFHHFPGGPYQGPGVAYPLENSAPSKHDSLISQICLMPKDLKVNTSLGDYKRFGTRFVIL